MAGVNKVILVGNLGKDPEVRTLENGRKVANFSLATSEAYKDKSGERVERTEWHNIVFWGPIAEVIERYVKKGSKIYVEGKLRTRSYEQEGVKKYITEIDGQNMTMLDSKGSDSERSYAPSPSSSMASTSSAPSVSLDDDESNDLPF
jgi:single-strand DNA-binding protein